MCTLETCTGDFTTFSAQRGREESSLHPIESSFAHIRMINQSFLPSYLPQDYFLFNLQLKKNRKKSSPHAQNSTMVADKNESLQCFSLSVGYGPRTDKNLLIFAEQLCSINIPTIKNQNKESFKYTNTRTSWTVSSEPLPDRRNNFF